MIVPKSYCVHALGCTSPLSGEETFLYMYMTRSCYTCMYGMQLSPLDIGHVIVSKNRTHSHTHIFTKEELPLIKSTHNILEHKPKSDPKGIHRRM